MFEKNNILKGFGLNAKKFFDGYVPLKEKTYCVVVIYDTNYKKEFYGITNPWKFINYLLKNPRIKSAYIKDENNP